MKRFVAVLCALLGLFPLRGEEWELVYPEEYEPSIGGNEFDAETTSVWDRLSFIYDNSVVVSISKDGEISEYPFHKPEFNLPWGIPITISDLEWYPEQMLGVNGEYFVMFARWGRAASQWEQANKLLLTNDFLNWRTIGFP